MVDLVAASTLFLALVLLHIAVSDGDRYEAWAACMVLFAAVLAAFSFWWVTCGPLPPYLIGG